MLGDPIPNFKSNGCQVQGFPAANIFALAVSNSVSSIDEKAELPVDSLIVLTKEAREVVRNGLIQSVQGSCKSRGVRIATAKKAGSNVACHAGTSLCLRERTECLLEGEFDVTAASNHEETTNRLLHFRG